MWCLSHRAAWERSAAETERGKPHFPVTTTCLDVTESEPVWVQPPFASSWKPVWPVYPEGRGQNAEHSLSLTT